MTVFICAEEVHRTSGVLSNRCGKQGGEELWEVGSEIWGKLSSELETSYAWMATMGETCLVEKGKRVVLTIPRGWCLGRQKCVPTIMW